MAYYKKKPVNIQAVQWKGGELSETPKWISEALYKNISRDNGAIMRMRDVIYIRTLEGVMIASDGDYIIKGVQGELYPCKPDIFKLTYDKL